MVLSRRLRHRAVAQLLVVSLVSSLVLESKTLRAGSFEQSRPDKSPKAKKDTDACIPDTSALEIGNIEFMGELRQNIEAAIHSDEHAKDLDIQTTLQGVTLVPRGGARDCPYCADHFIVEDQVWTCPGCKVPHHEECAQANRKCTTLGCTGEVPTRLIAQAKSFSFPEELRNRSESLQTLISTAQLTALAMAVFPVVLSLIYRFAWFPEGFIKPDFLQILLVSLPVFAGASLAISAIRFDKYPKKLRDTENYINSKSREYASEILGAVLPEEIRLNREVMKFALKYAVDPGVFQDDLDAAIERRNEYYQRKRDERAHVKQNKESASEKLKSE